MPRIRRKTTRRGEVKPQVYERAYLDIVSREVSIRCAAEVHGLDHVTLSRYVKRRAEKSLLQVRGYLNPNNRVFNLEQDGKLQSYPKRAAAIYFGLSPKEVSVEKTGEHKIKLHPTFTHEHYRTIYS